MGEGGRGGKGAKSGQARSACPRVKTRRDGREPVLAVTWRPFPGSYRGRHAGAVAASPAVSTAMIKCKKVAIKKCMKKGMRNDIGNTQFVPVFGAERVKKWKELDGWIFEVTDKKG